MRVIKKLTAAKQPNSLFRATPRVPVVTRVGARAEQGSCRDTHAKGAGARARRGPVTNKDVHKDEGRFF